MLHAVSHFIFCCVTILVFCMILACGGVYPLGFLTVCILLMCVIVYYWCADGMHLYIHASDFLISVWLFQDNQSAMYRSGQTLYIMHTLYLCMFTMIHCNQWDNVATSLLIIATNGLLSVTTHTSFANSNGGTSSPCIIPRASCSILL